MTLFILYSRNDGLFLFLYYITLFMESIQRTTPNGEQTLVDHPSGCPSLFAAAKVRQLYTTAKNICFFLSYSIYFFSYTLYIYNREGKYQTFMNKSVTQRGLTFSPFICHIVHAIGFCGQFSLK